MFGKRDLCSLYRLSAVVCAAMVVQSCSLTSYPTTAKDWDRQACNKYERSDYANASMDWDQAIKLDPDNPDLWWKRSRACMRFGRELQAIDDAKKAIDLLGDKDRRKLLFFELQLASAYAKNGNFDEARAHFAKSLELSDGKFDAAPIYMERGKMLLALADPKGAIVDLDKAIALVPTWGRAYFYRGKSYEKDGDPVTAAKDFQKALDMNYDDVVDRWEPLPIN